MREIVHTVAPGDDGREIKRVARDRMSLSYHQLSALKTQNGLLADGVPVHANFVVHAGMVVSVRVPDEPCGTARPCEGPVDIVYQDEDLMIINKQAPLACQSSDVHPCDALENYLAYLYAQRGEPFLFRPVNRLDKGTSGLMAVARHAHAQSVLQKQLHTPQFVREYLAVLCGSPPQEQGTVDAPIAKADGATVRRCVKCEAQGGQPSVTHYQVLRRCEERTLVRLRLETGRTHQIRVHMQHLGCPVFGDFLYGQEDERLPGRFALHSAHLRLTHPVTRRELAFEQPLPNELMRLMQSD